MKPFAIAKGFLFLVARLYAVGYRTSEEVVYLGIEIS
jgi:hypothetical protein